MDGDNIETRQVVYATDAADKMYMSKAFLGLYPDT